MRTVLLFSSCITQYIVMLCVTTVMTSEPNKFLTFVRQSCNVYGGDAGIRDCTLFLMIHPVSCHAEEFSRLSDYPYQMAYRMHASRRGLRYACIFVRSGCYLRRPYTTDPKHTQTFLCQNRNAWMLLFHCDVSLH